MSARPAQAGRAKLDIADVVRAHRARLESVHPLTRQQKRVLTDIVQCRTAVLGGHVDSCGSCGYEHPSYNSCRNRHCPKCQALAQEKWIAKRSEQLLDLRHVHVVFTLPAELRPLAKAAPRLVFDALLHAAARTLIELGHSRLHATLGATLVLHTWTRDLRFHPHVHAIVTAGGLGQDGQRFVRCRDGYLFPVKVMGKLLRGKMMAALRRTHATGGFAGFDDFQDPQGFDRLMRQLVNKAWNVYAKAPFAKSHHVLAYLGRYTHRVGIANSRLLEVTEQHVVFRTKGEATATLEPVEFLRRFVQHVLPDGFHKIRHVGLYASSCRDQLAVAHQQLGAQPPRPRPQPCWEQELYTLTGRDVLRCPACQAPLVRTLLAPSARGPPAWPPAPERERLVGCWLTCPRPAKGGVCLRDVQARALPCPLALRAGRLVASATG